MKKYVEVGRAKEFAGTFFGDPILKMAVNAALDHTPTVDLPELTGAEKQAVFRLGQMDMRESIADMLEDMADGTHGIVCSTLIDAAQRVRRMETIHEVCD